MAYVAECFWAGVREQDLADLDRRIAATAAVEQVRYLGRLLVLEDEVVLVLFEGPLAAVRHLADAAGIPFERLLQVSFALRADPTADEEESR
jgi:hypothetical protein